jgi:uncharacterized integral membrane protein
MLRKIVAAAILVPLAVLIVAFAVANRQNVTIAFDPFSTQQPDTVTEPLFVVILAALIAGVVIGGLASWLSHGRWRRLARRFERTAPKAAGPRGRSRSAQHRAARQRTAAAASAQAAGALTGYGGRSFLDLRRGRWQEGDELIAVLDRSILFVERLET